MDFKRSCSSSPCLDRCQNHLYVYLYLYLYLGCFWLMLVHPVFGNLQWRRPHHPLRKNNNTFPCYVILRSFLLPPNPEWSCRRVYFLCPLTALMLEASHCTLSSLVFCSSNSPTCSLQVMFLTLYSVFFSFQLVYILHGHALAMDPAFTQFIIPSKAEHFAFILITMPPALLVHFPVCWDHFERLFLQCACSSFQDGSSANLRVVFLSCLSASLMKKNELYQIQVSYLENQTQYSPSVWQ